MNVPLFGVVYVFAGTTVLLAEKLKRSPLQAAGILLIVIGVLNAYAEGWSTLKRYDLSIPILGSFFAAYSLFAMRLMKATGVTTRSAAVLHSFLPLMFTLAVGLAMAAPELMSATENLPLSMYFLLLLLVAIHVPMFAFGRSRAIQSQEAISPPALKSMHEFNAKIGRLDAFLLVLGAPLFACFVIQLVCRSDWRLLGANLIMTMVLGALLAICSSKRYRGDDGLR